IQQANGLARECEVLLMLPRDEAAEHQATIDPTIHYCPFDRPRLRQPVRQLMTVRHILKQIRQFRPDVIHFQQGHMWFNLALPLLRSYPLVVTIHDPRYHVGDKDSRRTPQGLMDFGFRRAGRVIVHGEALRRQVVELFGIAADKVHVVPHVAIGCASAPTNVADDGKSVLFFGRIWDYKGLKYLIKAEPLIRNAIPNVKIVIAGQGDDFEPYRRLMANPGAFEVHNRFITTSHRDELFEQATIVALPYIEATQSGVIPLAYSFAKPVVATRVGALADAVEDGVTGRLVPAADYKALAAAVIELLQNPPARHAMGVAGRRKLDAEWLPQSVAQQSMEVYRRAIRDRQRAPQLSATGERVVLEAK
ncbi:MAG TPA: glycosyltransferase family 4 protein, partial [Lacipirellulaceae bacterium]|nr:glycosyltransferase family 4 protein [Lacipirellulaceae bacterium]